MNDRHYTGFRMMDAITVTCIALVLAVSLTACRDSANQSSLSPAAPATASPVGTSVGIVAEPFSLTSLLDSIGGATSDVQSAVAPHADAVQARTREEVEKLFRWEYKVVDLSAQLSAEETQSALADLGSVGWECFSVIPQGSVSRVTCKRRPKSAIEYLKYIPGL